MDTEPNKPLKLIIVPKTHMHDQDASGKAQLMVVVTRHQQKLQRSEDVRMKARTFANLYARSQASGLSEDPVH